jgi:hypothetical protein
MAYVEVPVYPSITSIASPIPSPLEPEPIPEPVLTEEEKLLNIFKKLGAKRQEIISRYKIEDAKRPPEPIRISKPKFRKLYYCIREGNEIQCKK